MENTDIASRPEVRELHQSTDAIVSLASTYTVTTAEHYTAAGDDLKRVKAAQKRLEEVRTAITRPMDAAKKAVLEFFRAPEAKLADAENRIKRAMIGYQTEQERIRREQQAKLEADARKERERIAAQAAKAEAAGKVEKAEALQIRAAQVVAPVVMTEQPKVTGISLREVWRFEVVDATAVPREYLAIDEKKIGQIVRAMKGDTTIPGVRVWAEKQLAAGAA